MPIKSFGIVARKEHSNLNKQTTTITLKNMMIADLQSQGLRELTV
jgi:hypothetical protein